jgi:hypothetical protein
MDTAAFLATKITLDAVMVSPHGTFRAPGPNTAYLPKQRHHLGVNSHPAIIERMFCIEIVIPGVTRGGMGFLPVKMPGKPVIMGM